MTIGAILLATGLIFGVSGGYWLGRRQGPSTEPGSAPGGPAG